MRAKRDPVRRMVGYIASRIFSRVVGRNGEGRDAFVALVGIVLGIGESVFALGDGVDVSGARFWMRCDRRGVDDVDSI